MSGQAGRTMVCGFCAKEFVEDKAQTACGACALNGGCRWLRCPHCGYENPEPPRWMHNLMSLLQPVLVRGSHD